MSLYKRGLEKVNDKSSVSKVAVEKTLPKNSFKTDIDKFYHLIEVSSSGVTLDKVLEILDTSAADVEEWAKVLEKQGLIDVVYTPMGGTLFKVKGLVVVLEKKSFSFPKLSKKNIFLLLGFLFLFAVSLSVYFYWDTLFPEEEIRSESVATDVVVEESVETITLEDAFAGTGVYTCILTLGNFTEEYALNYSDFALVRSYNGDSSGTTVYLVDQKYNLIEGEWENSSIEESDVGPGRSLPSFDSYVCVQDSLNTSLFEVGL